MYVRAVLVRPVLPGPGLLAEGEFVGRDLLLFFPNGIGVDLQSVPGVTQHVLYVGKGDRRGVELLFPRVDIGEPGLIVLLPPTVLFVHFLKN